MRPRRVLRRRAVARAAVVGGAAYLAAKRGAQAGQKEQDEPDGRHDEMPPPGTPQAALEQLEELGELRAQGILTDEEFTAEKKKLLGV
jgi:hypothetical protein